MDIETILKLALILIIGITLTVGVIFSLHHYVSKHFSSTVSASHQDCSTNINLPSCDVRVRTNQKPSLLSGGFMTSQKILPTATTLDPQSSRYPLKYYHSHPSALFNSNVDSTLYTFPFLVQTDYRTNLPPRMNVKPYTFQKTAQELVTGYQQFFYSLDPFSSDNYYTMTFPTCTANFLLANSIDDIVLPENYPSLTTILKSDENMALIFAQGVPYYTLSPSSILGQSFTVFGYNGGGTLTITSDAGVQFVIRGLTLTPTSTRTIVLIYPTTNHISSITYVANLLTVNTAVSTSREFYYLCLLKDLPINLVELIRFFKTFVGNLNVPIVTVTDICTSADVAVRYTCTTVQNESLLFIPSTTIRTTYGLEELHGVITRFDCPQTTPLYRTFPTAGTSNLYRPVSFYFLWPLEDVPEDFNYVFPVNYTEQNTERVPDSLIDLFELSSAIRVMAANQLTIPDEMSKRATFGWRDNMQKIIYDPMIKSLRVENLGKELGLITYFCYLLLVYINLFRVNQTGVWPSTSTYSKIVSDNFFHTLIIAIIENCFTTELPNPSTYFPLQLVDFYTCTLPNVAYDSDNIIAYQSRVGEALGFCWAAYTIRTNLTVSDANANSASLIRSVYSMITHTTPYLLREECFGETPSIFPTLPWSGLVSSDSYGFTLDTKGQPEFPLSPDGVFTQSILPVTPASNKIVKPILEGYSVSLFKILKCPLTNPDYYFGGYVDPRWVAYFLYLFEAGDRTTVFTQDALTPGLKVFIKTAYSPETYTLYSLFLNSIKH